MNIKTIVNQNGEIVEICVIENTDGSYQDYALKNGEKAVEYINNVLINTNGVSHSPLKPHWNGTKWIELATVEELERQYPPQPPLPPTIEERTSAMETAMMTIMGGLQNV